MTCSSLQCHGSHRKEAERVDMEEKYASLQEEAAAKSSRLKEVWREFQQAKEEVPVPAVACMY